ncbi:hypothetical protein ATANTOWER_025043 [Ataeniobius toweri]|uniref:Uncharacterized protein n=1 Tax=Ataeniobius toweri TaxID=208326 RepID=A0ABU7AMB3_9TELE|nr:hypothetical protein [Ataeniobius toweri]
MYLLSASLSLQKKSIPQHHAATTMFHEHLLPHAYCVPYMDFGKLQKGLLKASFEQFNHLATHPKGVDFRGYNYCSSCWQISHLSYGFSTATPELQSPSWLLFR